MDIHRNALASIPPLCGMVDGCQQGIVESRSANVMHNLCSFTIFLAKIAYKLRYFYAILMVGRPERKPRLISAFSPSKPKPDSTYVKPSPGLLSFILRPIPGPIPTEVRPGLLPIQSSDQAQPQF